MLIFTDRSRNFALKSQRLKATGFPCWFSFKYVIQWWSENILLNHSCFFFTSKKIKYRSNLAASSDFAVTSRRMIIYTGKTFPIAIMSDFMPKLYMQHLRSLFWFLLTILSILSLTAFPLISVKSQISTAPTSYKHLTYKCSFYQKPVHYLTVTKIKYIWDKYIYIEAIQITTVDSL